MGCTVVNDALCTAAVRVGGSLSTTRSIRIGEEMIQYSLKRSQRRKKTIGLKVARKSVEVVAPSRTSIREVEEILRKRGNWILGKLLEAEEGPPSRRWVSGESIPFLGEELELRVEESTVRGASARLDGKTLSVVVPQLLTDYERLDCVKRAVAGWYKHQMEEILRGRVPHWLQVMAKGDTPNVVVREQRARWGSCGSDGTLRFSWRLGMVEPDLVDSVVVHELAHLEVMNHSPAFWRVVLRAMPDARERRKRLNEAGRQIPL